MLNTRHVTIGAGLALAAAGADPALAGAGYRAGSFAEFRIEGWAESGNRLQQPPTGVSVTVGGSAPAASRNDPNRADGDGAIRLPEHDKHGKVKAPATGTAVAALSAAWGSSVCNTTGTSSDTATAWILFTNNTNREYQVFFSSELTVSARAWGDDPTKDVSWSQSTSSMKATNFDAGVKPLEAIAHFPAQLGDHPNDRDGVGANKGMFITLAPKKWARVDLSTTAHGKASTTCTPAPGGAAVMVVGGVMAARRRRR